MNHCLIQGQLIVNPKLRYTQDNKTPITEIEVLVEGLRDDDPKEKLKVVGWGNIAQQMESELKVNDSLIFEGRLRMSMKQREDGTKEKIAELTVSKFRTIHNNLNDISPNKSKENEINKVKDSASDDIAEKNNKWYSSPLVPEVDEIPF